MEELHEKIQDQTPDWAICSELLTNVEQHVENLEYIVEELKGQLKESRPMKKRKMSLQERGQGERLGEREREHPQ